MSTPPETSAARPAKAMSLHGTAEFGEWVEGLADHVGLPQSFLMEIALRELAERRGYAAMPRRRPGRRKPA